MRHLYRRHNMVLERPECWCNLTIRPGPEGFETSVFAKDVCADCLHTRREALREQIVRAEAVIERAKESIFSAERSLHPLSFHGTHEPYGTVG